MFPTSQLAHIAAFAQVARERSFTAAARVLGVSKSVVSAQVRSLEESLGVRLFERTTRTLVLTPAGERVLAATAQMLAAADEIQRAADDHRDAVAGTLRVATSHELGVRLVASVLTQLALEHAQLNVELLCDDATIDIGKQQVDAAVRIDTIQNAPPTAQRVGIDAEIIVAAPELAQRFRDIVNPAELNAAPWVLHKSVDRAGGHAFHRGEETALVTVTQPRAIANATHGMLNFLLGGVGFGILPHFMVRDLVAAGQLLHVLPSWYRRPLGIYVVLSNQPPTRRAVVFTNALCAFLAKSDFGAAPNLS